MLITGSSTTPTGAVSAVHTISSAVTARRSRGRTGRRDAVVIHLSSAIYLSIYHEVCICLGIVLGRTSQFLQSTINVNRTEPTQPPERKAQAHTHFTYVPKTTSSSALANHSTTHRCAPYPNARLWSSFSTRWMLNVLGSGNTRSSWLAEWVDRRMAELAGRNCMR